ncbi:hypothetical protein Ahy_A06g028462 [Arachis hypogaea]|uniref:S-adenosylmethionine synthase n=2 Tax=Arachis TaxID=3817 RepID=A0A445CR31_ARAHY|nr:hypothetical protein Ahy_A06g028462 [Arachis hypogaea]
MSDMETFLFTSESVNEGHPDKICDQVSDAILDACLEQDPESKVACETCTKTNMVMVFGEITTKANVNYEKIVRDTCRGIGFVSADVGLDADNCKVLVNIEQQSPDIAQGVHGHMTKKPEEIGAGDQGHMFGYATDETPELMPLTHVLATKLGAKLTEVRKNKTCPWVRPNGKTQVTVEKMKGRDCWEMERGGYGSFGGFDVEEDVSEVIVGGISFEVGMRGCAVAEQTTGERGQSFQEEQRGVCRGANTMTTEAAEADKHKAEAEQVRHGTNKRPERQRRRWQRRTNTGGVGTRRRSRRGECVNMETFLFTSESVNEGHPDKICDQVSDAILDACLEQDPESKVACETCTKTNMVMVFGEITTKANVNYEKIVRDTCRGIGFVSADVGLDADNCKVLVNIEQQSPDIAQGVHGHMTKKPEEIGAGDQGHMFGYATDETPELMPLTHVLATKLGAKLTEVRKNKTCPWVRPDGKTQVTVEYKNDNGAMIPIRVHTVLISTQHDETVTNDKIASDLKEHVIKPVIPAKYLDDKTIFHLNPSGRFVIGGPHGDAGLTGRKIIIDTYGGWGAHGGGAFSGKDPTKVDRSGAYIVRQAAKSVVASGLARRCLVQVSYAIGVPEPLSVFVDTYKTGKIPDKDILALIKENFDFRPGMIAINLDLMRGGNFRYQKTAAYGHFGRDDPDFTWETVKMLKPKA